MPIIEVDPKKHLKPQDLKINPEFKKLIPRLGGKELEQLESNILSEGCRYPIVHWNGYIVDGHHRHKICKRHNIGFRTIPLNPQIETEEEVKVWMLRNALGTRTLTTYQQTELAWKLKEFAFSSRQGKRTDLEKEKEREQEDQKRRTLFQELKDKDKLTPWEIQEKRKLENYFGSQRDRLKDLQRKENLESHEKEAKEFLECFFTAKNNRLEELKNKSNPTLKDKKEIESLVSCIFGHEHAEKTKKEENEKRLQELQDKENLNLKEVEERKSLEKFVYGINTSVRIFTEVDEDSKNKKEEERLKRLFKQKEEPSEKMADSLGISRKTLSKSRYIEKHADEELKLELREGKKSIDGAYRKLKAQKWDYVGCFPKHDYRVFYADFWGKTISDNIESVYIPDFGIRSITDLKQLPIKEFPNKKGAICFLWSPLQKLDVTISVLNTWGFSYKTLFTLETDKQCDGKYNSIDSLAIVVGVYKYDCEPDTKRPISSTLNKSIAGKNRVFEFRKIIDQMYTSGNKIQLFSDNKSSTWDAILG